LGETSIDRFETVRRHIDNWLSTAAKQIISSSKVKDIINDWDNQEANYQIVSVRLPEHYAQGHVPDAINIPFRQIADDSSLALLESDKTIIPYCYTGHTGQIATTILNVLNFDAKNMKFGMMDWNLETFKLSGANEWDGIADHEVETTPHTLVETYSTPVITTHLDDAVAILKENAITYLSTTINTLKFTISSSDVKTIVDDWENQQDEYQIVSVRAPEHYAMGHVPQAINIPWTQVAQLDNLQMLDPNKTLIVYCYTGHTGQIATTVLNLLGYKAHNMTFGMMDWNLATIEANGIQPWDGEADYPVEQ
jgi:rhodanese-related sulfurtransferase